MHVSKYTCSQALENQISSQNEEHKYTWKISPNWNRNLKGISLVQFGKLLEGQSVL